MQYSLCSVTTSYSVTTESVPTLYSVSDCCALSLWSSVSGQQLYIASLSHSSQSDSIELYTHHTPSHPGSDNVTTITVLLATVSQLLSYNLFVWWTLGPGKPQLWSVQTLACTECCTGPTVQHDKLIWYSHLQCSVVLILQRITTILSPAV